MPSDSIGNAPGQGSLRYGGVSLPGIPEDGNANLPSTQSKAVKRQMAAVQFLRDAVAGPSAIRDAGNTYLPQAPGETNENYQIRLRRSVYVNITGRTLDGLVGQLFRRDPELKDDVPAVIVQHAENIDLAGTHFVVFARRAATDAITAGHGGILVEYPKTDGTQTHADELTVIRPYWVPVRKDDIVSWRVAVVNGQTVLTQLVLKECQQVAVGAFGEKEQERYRVLYRNIGTGEVGFVLLEITENREVIEVDRGTYPTQVEIPFAELTTSGHTGLLESTPPLLDLAYLNIAHYQTLSDYLTSIHKTCVPIWVEAGADVDQQTGQVPPLVLGPNSARISSNPQFKAGYQAHDGSALKSVAEAIQNMLADMGRLGLAMITPQNSSGPETATAHRQDKSTEDSDLATTARGLEDAFERALGFHARYMKLPSGGSVAMNREFDEQEMSAQMLVAWTGAVANAGIPERYMIADMQKGGLIPREEDPAAIADEVMANREAAAEADAQRQADLLALKTPQQPPKGAA